MVSCKSPQRLGGPIPSSSPLEGPGHYQATWAAPLPPGACVAVTRGTLLGGGLALDSAPGQLGRHCSHSHPNPNHLTPSPASVPPSCCPSTQVGWGPRPGLLGQPRGLWPKKGDSGNALPRREAIASARSPLAGLTSCAQREDREAPRGREPELGSAAR